MRGNRCVLSLFIVTFVLAFSVGLSACSTNGESSSTKAPSDTVSTTSETSLDLEAAIANAQADDPYVADEVCLSCHGGTYESIAELTDDLGDSNPHAGTHGFGGMSCDNCHTDGQSPPSDEDNLCLGCHIWPRDDESYIEYMDL